MSNTSSDQPKEKYYDCNHQENVNKTPCAKSKKTECPSYEQNDSKNCDNVHRLKNLVKQKFSNNRYKSGNILIKRNYFSKSEGGTKYLLPSHPDALVNTTQDINKGLKYILRILFCGFLYL
jgi:hypothetical protein